MHKYHDAPPIYTPHFIALYASMRTLLDRGKYQCARVFTYVDCVT